MPARRSRQEDSRTRIALLDAAQELMLEEGSAAVTSRRVAARAGLNTGLVYYYFGPMDELFVALFQRRAEWMLERQAQALASEQPLWALWDVIHNEANSALNLEFLALGNHRKRIRDEINSFQRKFRRMQLGALSSILERYGVDPEEWPPMAVAVLLTGIAWFLDTEVIYDIDTGHVDAVAVIERYIRRIEGERRRPMRRPVTRVDGATRAPSKTGRAQ
jgi:AcrR family transcriptional regulator